MLKHFYESWRAFERSRFFVAWLPWLLYATFLIAAFGLIYMLGQQQAHKYTVCEATFAPTCVDGDSYVKHENCVTISNTTFCGNYTLEAR